MSTSPPARSAWTAAGAVALLVQLAVLYAPRVPPVPGAEVAGLDKLVHAAVFAAVTFTALRAGLRPALVVGVGLAHAVVSEVLQHAVLPGRSGDPVDVLADVVGVALGAWLAALTASGRGRTGRGR